MNTAPGAPGPIVLFGAGGVGRRILHEALQRGHTVRAVVRRPEAADLDPRADSVRGDATEAGVAPDLVKGAAAVVLAISDRTTRPWRTAAEVVTRALADLPAPKPRLLHIGGGATLLRPDGTRILDAPGFPDQFRPSAEGQAAALDWYRTHATPLGVTWTYLSPPPVHFAPGDRRGTYRTGGDHPVTDTSGTASLSYEDLAVAVIDEIEAPRYDGQRFTAGY